MPVRYVCKKCGHVLYHFERVGQDFMGVRTPSELRIILAGKCPRCGHPFETPKPEDITIKLIGK